MTVMDDLISRQAAIDALNEVSEHYTDKGREWHPHIDFMVQAIEELPSAQPKKGRWLNHLGLPLSDFCSVCANDSPYNKHWDFCPNCGADTRGDENG